MASDVTTTTNATTGNVTATEQSGQNQTNTVNVNTTADTASQTGNVSVTLNSGANDTVNVAAKGAVTVTVGNGAADTVNVNNLATDTANVTVTMGTGSGDQVNINDASLRNTVVTKDVAGNAVGDTVNITDSNASAVNIVTMGNANGDTAIINSAGLTNTVTMGSGDNDSVTIVDSNALSRNTVNMGAGNNDAIKIISDGTTSITAAEAVISGVEVSLGAGNNQTIDILGNGTTSMDLGNTNNTITTGTGKTTIYADDGNNVIRTDMAILNAGTALAAFSSMQNLVGDLAKYISLGAGNNSVFVGSGNSTILAGDGSNTVMAGDGNNTVKLGNGNDSVTVGNGTAYSTTNTTTNVTVNYAGGDTIIAGDGNDTVVAGNGNNNIRLGNGNDSVTVGDGKAYTSVNNTTNVTTNYAGYNTIIAGNGNDTVVAGNGNNNVQLGNGVDSVTLGNGNNTVRLGNGTSLTNVGTNKDTVVAGNGNNNIIIGDGDNSSITVGNGNNVIGVGYGNNDVVIAGNGNNRVYASDKDYVVGETDSDHDAGGIGKTQTITMGNGNDVVDAGMSNLNITLGHGTDTIWTSDGNSTIMVDQGAAAPGQLDGNKYISVGNGNNTIVAGNGNNTVIAGDGIKPYPLFKDNITLGNGNNRVLVRDGLDSSASMDTIITVGQGNNTITVGDGNDKIMAGDGTAYSVTNATTNVTTNYAGGNTVVGGNGNDVVIAGNGNNNIRLGNGNDTVTVGDGKAYSSVNNTTNVTTNYAGGNTITVGDGNDVITAGNGNNSINVGNGNDNIHVGNGANRISFGDGNDVIVAGDGNNTISSKDSANGEGVPEIPTTAGTVSITVGNGNNSIWGGQDRTVNVMAGNGANTITVGNGVDSVTVGDGNNRITYGNGGDIIHAGDGNNVISTIFDGDYAANLGLGDSDDKYASHVQDQIFVGQGNNTIVAGAMDTTIMAGNGNNTITGRDLSLADLVLHNLPVLNNSASHLSITVGMGHNTIRLGGGDDTVMASDTFATSAGNVRANTITGGNGNDTVTVGDGNNSISLGSGNDMITAGNGNNAIVGKSVAGTVDTIVVGNGNNSITTGAGDDIITAGNGNNVINAGAGNDIITVGNGNNTITGGTGSDMVTVGKGTNTVTMGDGVDQVTLNISAADLNPPAVHETLNGGGGIDTLVIHVSEADSHNVAYMNALNALAADIAYRVAHNTTGSWATNAALGIKYVNFENVIIDIAAPANHAPTDISLSNNSVDENSPAGTLVANLSASDPDAGDTFTFSLVNASSQFQIVGNQLQVKAGAVIDYETTQQIPLSIQVMDNHGATFVKNININVNNLNDNAPELHVIGAVTNVDENTVNVVMAAFSPITDADGNLNPLSYILSGADAAKFQMQGDNLVLISPADYETQHSLDVTVTATDGLNNSLLPQNFTFAVNNLNDNAPVLHLVSQQANVDENAANVVMAAFSPITDADGALNPLIYVLSGADAAKFQMQGDNLVLINAADYEAQHSLNVTVTATDGLNNSLLPQNFTFAVNNLNDNAPVLHFVSAVTSVDENTANVVMAAFSPITDADGNLNPLSYILSGADAAKFQMQGDNLVLISPADYETQHSLTVIVTATDGNNISIPSQGFNFAVNDVNEAPTALNLSATNVDENVAAGTVIGNLSDVDPDTNPAFNGAAYSLVAGYGDNSAFSVVGNQLVINVSPDFETKSSYDIKVHVDDGSATGLDQTFTINVNDLNENLPPLFTNNTDYVQFNPFGTVSFFAGIPFATPLSTQNLSSYDPSTWYNALDGNDIVKGLENLIGLDTHAFHGGAGNDSLEISSGLSNQTMQGLYGDAGNDTLSIISYSDPFHPRYSLSDNSVVTMVGGAGDDTLNLGQTDYGVNGSTSHFVLGYDMSMNNGNDTVNRFNTAPLGQMSYDVLSFSNIPYAALLADTSFTADVNGRLMLNLFSDAAHLNAIGTIDFTNILYDVGYSLVSATSDSTQVHLEIVPPTTIFTNNTDYVQFNPFGTVSFFAGIPFATPLSTQNLSSYDPSTWYNALDGNDIVKGLENLIGLDTHAFHGGAGNDSLEISSGLSNQTMQGLYGDAGNDTLSIISYSDPFHPRYSLSDNSVVTMVGGAGDDTLNLGQTDYGVNGSTSHFVLGYDMSMNNGNDTVNRFNTAPLGQMSYDVLSFSNISYAALLADTTFTADLNGNLMLNLFSDAAHLNAIGSIDFTDILYDARYELVSATSDPTQVHLEIALPPLFTNGNDNVVFNPDGTVSVYADSALTQLLSTQSLSYYDPSSLNNTLAGNDTVEGLQYLAGLDTHNFQLGSGVDQAIMSVSGFGIYTALINQTIQGIYAGNGGDTISISANSESVNASIPNGVAIPYGLYNSSVNLVGGQGNDSISISATATTTSSEPIGGLLTTAYGLYNSSAILDGGAGNDNLSISANNMNLDGSNTASYALYNSTATLDGGTGDDLLSVTASATDVNPTALPTHTVVDALANNSVAEIYGGQGNDTIALGNTDNTSHFTLDYNMAENSGADMVTGFMANNAGYQLNFSNVPGAGDLATVLADTSFSDDGSGHLMLSLWSDASHTTSIGTLDFMDVNFDPNALYLLSGALGAEIIVVDHAPILANQIADQVVNVGQALNFSVANTFSDGDVGDVLTYSATLANGDPLPSWLAFDPNTQTFSGTDATAETLSVKVVATDAYGLSASDTFNITVNALPPLFTNNADNVVFSPVNFGVYQASNDGGTTFHDLSYFDPSTLYNTFAGNDTVLVQDSLGGIQGFSIVTGDGNDVISLLESNGYLQNNTITLGAGAFDSVDLEAGGFNPNLGLGFLHGNTINFAADGQAGHTYSLNVAITAQGVSGNVISLQGMGNDVVNLLNVGASQSTIAFASAQDGSHDGMSGFVFGSGGTTMDLSQLFSSVPTMMSQDDGNGHLLAQFSDGFHTLSIDFTDVNFDPNADYALIGNSLSSEHILPSLFTNNADNVVFNGDGTVSVYADSALTQLLGTHSLSYYAQSTWYNTFGGNDTVYVANGPNSADISGYNFTMGDGNDTIDFITAGNAGIQSNVITLGAGAADSVDLKAADTVSRNTICFAADGQAGHTYSLNVAITAGLVFGNTITLAGSGNDVVNLLNAGASLSTIAFASAQDGAHDSMSGFALGSLSVATAGTILDLSNLFSSVPTMMSQDDGSGHLLARFSDGSHNLSIDFTDISFNPTLDYFLSGASLSAQNILAAPPLFTNGNDTVDFATVNTANYDPNSLYNTLAGNDTVNNLQDLTGLDTHTFVLGDLVGQTDNVNMGPLSQQNIMGIQGGAGTDNITISDSVNDQISSSVVAKTIFDSSVALDGGAGNDALNISAMASGSNSVTAYALNNNFGIIDYYVVTLDGGDGNDALSISATASSSGSANSTSATAYALSGYDLAMDGGAGDDTLSISATTSTPIDTHSETSYALFNSMVTMDGGDGNDALNISAAALGDLNSTAYALNVSTVTLDGGTGDDTLSISATASNASTTANSVFDGARAYAVLASTVTMDGGDGNDALSISATASGASSAAIAVFFSTATLDGGAGNDIVTVTATDTDVTSVTYALLSSTVTLDGGDGNDTLSISATSSGTGSVALALYNSTATLNGGAGNDILAVTATGTNTDIASFALYRNSVAEIYGGTGNDTIILGNTDNGVVYTGPNPVSTSHFSLDYNMAENSGADVVTGFMLNNAGYQLNFLNVPGAGDIVALLADTSFSNDGSGHLMLNLWSDASHTISIGTVDFTDISFDPTLDYFLSGASLSAQNILSAPPLFTNGNDTVDFATVNTANYAPNSLYNTLAGNDTVNNLQDLTGLDTHDFHLGNGVNQVNMSVVGTGVPNVICNQVIQGIYDGNGGDTINISSDFSGGFNSSGDGSGTLYQSTITLHAGSGGDTFNITARSPYYSTCAIFLSTANLLGGTGDDTMTISANGYGGNSEFNTALFHSTVLMDGGAGNDIMTISASGGLFNFGIEGNSIATMIGGAGNDTMNLGAADGTSHYVVQYNNENGGTDTVNGFNVGSDVLLFKGLLDAGNSNVLDLAHLDTISTMVNDGSGHAELKITAGGAAGTNVIFTNVAFDGNTAIEHYINSANIQFA